MDGEKGYIIFKLLLFLLMYSEWRGNILAEQEEKTKTFKETQNYHGLAFACTHEFETGIKFTE